MDVTTASKDVKHDDTIQQMKVLGKTRKRIKAVFSKRVIEDTLSSLQSENQKNPEEGEFDKPTQHRENQYTMSNERAWLYINNICLNERSMYPDLGNSANLSKGNGVHVAILDGGILWSDPDFQENPEKLAKVGEPGCRIVKYWDFGDPKKAMPEEDAASIHGTLMAKLVGFSNFNVNGIAPNVKFIDLKIASTEEEILKLREDIEERAWQAFKMRDVDVFFASLCCLTFTYPLDVEWYTRRIKYKGNETLVSCPVGNYGRQSLFATSLKSTFESVFSVGEYYMTYKFELTWRCNLGPYIKSIPAAYLSTKKMVFSTVQSHSVLYFLDKLETFSSLKKKIKEHSTEAVILHCTTKYKFCEDAINYMVNQKIVKVVFLVSNNVEPWIDGFPHHLLPIILVSPKHKCDNFFNFLKKKKEKMCLEWEMTYKRIAFPSLNSAIGPHPALKIKPDLMVIGGSINVKSYIPKHHLTDATGTCPANARFAGMLALYVEEFKKQNKPITFKEALLRAQNTATPYVYQSNQPPDGLENTEFYHEHTRFKGLAASVAWQGAGLVNLERMVHTKLLANPSKLELGYFHPEFHTFREVQLTLTNQGDIPVEYTFQHLPAVALWTYKGGNRQYATQRCSMKVTLNMKTDFLGETDKILVIPAHGNITLSFIFAIPKQDLKPFTFLSGYLHFKPISESNSSHYGPLHIPYLLMYGNRRKYPFIHSIQNEIQRVADLINPGDLYPGNFFQTEEDPITIPKVFTLQTFDRPLWKFKTTFSIQEAHLVVKYAHEDKILGFVTGYSEEFGLNQTYHSPLSKRYGIGWDGTFFDAIKLKWYKVNSGEYRFCYNCKLLGDDDLESFENEPKHVEECSPSFFIEVENEDFELLDDYMQNRKNKLSKRNRHFKK